MIPNVKICLLVESWIHLKVFCLSIYLDLFIQCPHWNDLFIYSEVRETDRKLSHPVIHSPNGSNSQYSCRQKTAGKNFIQIPYVCGRLPSLFEPQCSPGALTGSWIRSGAAEIWTLTLILNTDVPRGTLTHCTTTCAPPMFLYNVNFFTCHILIFSIVVCVYAYVYIFLFFDLILFFQFGHYKPFPLLMFASKFTCAYLRQNMT